MRISSEEYLSERLDGQIQWYDSKSMQCQKTYKGLKRTEVITAAMIPLLSGIAVHTALLAVALGALGALIAVIEGLLNIGRYHENWIDYRTICETLRHEKYMFLTNTGVYSNGGHFESLVERVESIISKENVNWAALNTPTDKAKPDK